MVNEYLTRAYDTKVIFRELLCFYAPFGWVPVKENRAPNPNPPVHKMYDGNTVWSMEKQDYVSDYDVGRKRSEKIVVKRNTKFTRNNRLMTEEALMEYHLRWRYWFYPRCNKLRLINRCRPFWGILWAVMFLVCLFLHLTFVLGNPESTMPVELFAGMYDSIYNGMATSSSEFVSGTLFDITHYGSFILGAFNFIMLVYQLFSNRTLKKNTERIIECCVNGKAIVKAMQYEDITLMNGRQRQRYYQGQVINEAARNTGDPLYFGS